ncbi:MAG TPA: ATP-binding protein [Opitutaceae bacterium]|nr:ATP-binding protein [Opitutaceae bacterium]
MAKRTKKPKQGGRSGSFKISSALKTIIGRELITNDLVAVFELVKNSFDAHAKNAEIRFENLGGDTASLVIKDDGKGMTAGDIEAKWLFVAYSAKRDGTEDNEEGKPKNYRDKIQSVRVYAGAKGIGRFSCDRLGQHLDMFTRTSGNEGYEWLSVDWSEFEKDSKREFIDIKVERGTVDTCPYPLKGGGTVLVISSLREEWDRPRLVELRNSLRKLINPNQENDVAGFSVELIVPTERAADKREPDSRARVNGPVRNFLFEELGLKTTEIHCEVDKDSEVVTTTLTDRGTLIYRIREKCPYLHLARVRVDLFALNRSAKLHFHKVMGVHNVEYGSVFLYKNGFRVHPIGDAGDDRLGVDRRKQQGTARYLGTRDVSGRIEVTADNSRFKEVSSRDGGLIVSPEWKELVIFFYDFALRRLEKYVVDVIKWGNAAPGSEDEIEPKDVKAQILDIIRKLTDSEDVLGVEYDRNLLDIIAERQSASVTTALENFRRIAAQNNDPALAREVARAERRIKKLAEAKEEAEKESRSERKARLVSERSLVVERQKNRFLMAHAADPDKQRLHIQHWVGIGSGEMSARIKKLMQGVKAGTIQNEELLEGLGKLQFWVDQLVNAARIATRADFNLQYPTRRMDLAQFMAEYLQSDIVSKPDGLRIHLNNSAENFVVMMRPVEITILFDNLISNAVKAHARNLHVSLRRSGSRLTVVVRNDGEAVPKHLVESMFELGISGRGGSGIGLHTCREIVKGMSSEIRFGGNDPQLGGAVFEMTFFS